LFEVVNTQEWYSLEHQEEHLIQEWNEVHDVIFSRILSISNGLQNIVLVLLSK
jgi:hypothetical protein